jgi:hypothetical protein
VVSTDYDVQLFDDDDDDDDDDDADNDDDDSNDSHQDVVQGKRGAARKFASYKFILKPFKYIFTVILEY